MIAGGLGIPYADASRFGITPRSRLWIRSSSVEALGSGLVLHDPRGGVVWTVTRCGVPTFETEHARPLGTYVQLGALNLRRVRLCRRCYRGALRPIDVARLSRGEIAE